MTSVATSSEKYRKMLVIEGSRYLVYHVQSRKLLQIHEPPHDKKKKKKWSLRPAKTQISLDIRPVWSESLQCAHWVAEDLRFLHADSKVSDQTGHHPPSLIWVFAGRTVHFVGFVMRRLIWSFCCKPTTRYARPDTGLPEREWWPQHIKT